MARLEFLIVYFHQESDKIEGFNKTLEAPWKDFMAVKRQNEKDIHNSKTGGFKEFEDRRIIIPEL